MFIQPLPHDHHCYLYKFLPVYSWRVQLELSSQDPVSTLEIPPLFYYEVRICLDVAIDKPYISRILTKKSHMVAFLEI